MYHAIFITIISFLEISTSTKKCVKQTGDFALEVYDQTPGGYPGYACNGNSFVPQAMAIGGCPSGVGQKYYHSFQCAKDTNELYNYQLESYGYVSTGDGTVLSGYLAHCWGYGSCCYSQMTFGSSIKCFGARSCQYSTMSFIYAVCGGYESCYQAKMTQTQNGDHQMICSGASSCRYAEIGGANGVNLVFTGDLSAEGAIITAKAGTTSKIDCRKALDGTDVVKCGTATLVIENGATVECTSDGQSQAVSECGQIVNVPPGVDLDDFIRDNVRKEPDDLPRPDDGFFPGDDYEEYPHSEPKGGYFINLNDPMYIMGFLLVLSIILNCCQGYNALFGSFSSQKRRKKVYQGIAQTDNSEVEFM